MASLCLHGKLLRVGGTELTLYFHFQWTNPLCKTKTLCMVSKIFLFGHHLIPSLIPKFSIA